MKNKLFHLLTLCPLFVLAGCDGLRDDQDPAPAPGSLVEIVSEETLTHEVFLENFSQFIGASVSSSSLDVSFSSEDVAKIIGNIHRNVLDNHFAKEQYTKISEKPKWGIRRIVYKYNSTDHNGNPCVITASAQYPCTLNNLYKHEIPILASFSNIFSGTSGRSTLSFFPYASGKVYQDALLVVPDYEGLDPSSPLRQNVFQSDLLARQQVDAVLAAMEIISNDENNSLSDDFHTENVGISRGGMVALAFAKYMDSEASQEIQDKIRLKGSFCAVGPFIQEPVLEHMVNDGTSLGGMSGLFTYFITSAFRTAPELFKKWKTEDLFSDEYNNKVVEYEGKSYSLIEYTESLDLPKTLSREKYAEMDYDVRRMISPDMLAADSTVNYTSEKYLALNAVAKRNNTVDGWTPKHPVRIAYSPDDEFIPVEVGEYAYNILRDASRKNNGAPVTQHRLSIPSSMSGTSAHFLASIYYILYIALVPTPWAAPTIMPDIW